MLTNEYNNSIEKKLDINNRDDSEVKPIYLDFLTLIDRLHRRLLDVIKDEFDRSGGKDITPVQALMLYQIGDDDMMASELRSRGAYLGTNISYNLKKLVEGSYVYHERSYSDRRVVKLRLTSKGRKIADIIDKIYDKHLFTLDKVAGVDIDNLSNTVQSMRRVERFWTDTILYKL